MTNSSSHQVGHLAHPKLHLMLALLLGVILVGIGLVAPEDNPQASSDGMTTVDAVIGPSAPAYDPAAMARLQAAAEAAAAAERVAWHTVRVRNGDSLANIFKREGLKARDLALIVDSGGEARRLRRIRPGQSLQYRRDDSGELAAVRFAFSPLEAVEAVREGDGFATRLVTREPERRIRVAEATIDSSLFVASQRVGLDVATTMNLAGIFQWDIDFVLDIREGDAFHLVYEELWLDGERIGSGDILAAEFINQGDSYRAVRYEDADGYASYYTPDGLSMRKAFLRAPVEFSRISSNFNLRRRHPIRNTVRPHRGIDYAAPTGTPIRAAGDGKVMTAASHHANGNYVVLAHGEQYQTKYLHMSRIARGIRPGARVQQGQVIGYVGATGLATGPHLHYEFLVHGVHQNPRTVELPKALPIPDEERMRFMAATRPLMAQLDELRETQQIALSPAGP